MDSLIILHNLTLIQMLDKITQKHIDNLISDVAKSQHEGTQAFVKEYRKREFTKPSDSHDAIIDYICQNFKDKNHFTSSNFKFLGTFVNEYKNYSHFLHNNFLEDDHKFDSSYVSNRALIANATVPTLMDELRSKSKIKVSKLYELVGEDAFNRIVGCQLLPKIKDGKGYVITPEDIEDGYIAKDGDIEPDSEFDEYEYQGQYGCRLFFQHNKAYNAVHCIVMNHLEKTRGHFDPIKRVFDAYKH